MAYVTYNPQFQRQRFRNTQFAVQRSSQLSIPERPLRKPPSYRQTPPAPKVQQQTQQQQQVQLTQAQPIYTYYPQNVATQQSLYQQQPALYSQQSLYPIATIPTQQPQSYEYQYYPQTVTPIQRKPAKPASKSSGPGWALCWTFVKEGWCPYNPCHWSHGEGDYKRPAVVPKKKPSFYNAPQRRPRRIPPKGSGNGDFDVCWEHNSSSGCSRGAKCWWKHSLLRETMVHPYTGEKLNGPRAGDAVAPPKVYAAEPEKVAPKVEIVKAKPKAPVKTSEVATNTDPADWPAIAMKSAVAVKDKAESDDDVKEYEADKADAGSGDDKNSKSIAIQVAVVQDVNQEIGSEETKEKEVAAIETQTEEAGVSRADDDEKEPVLETPKETTPPSNNQANQEEVFVAADTESDSNSTVKKDSDSDSAVDAQKTPVLGSAAAAVGTVLVEVEDKTEIQSDKEASKKAVLMDADSDDKKESVDTLDLYHSDSDDERYTECVNID